MLFRSWTQSSDERLKTDIQDEYLGLDFINEIRPVIFKWKPSNEIPQELTNYYREENVRDTETVQHGLIAQNVRTALDKFNDTSFPGWDVEDDGTQGVGAGAFVIPLIKAVQELSQQLKDVKAELAELKGTQ